MSREKEFAKNTLVLSVGKMLPKLTTFITLPILTAYLTKAEMGTYDLLTTLVMLVLPIATLQIQSAAFRFLIDCRGDKEKSSSIISNIFIVTLPVSIIASIIIQFFFMDFSADIRILIALYFLVDTIQLTLGQVVRGLGYNNYYSIGAILLSIVNMCTVFVGVYLSKAGLLGVMIALVLANVTGIVFLLLKVKLFDYISLKKVSKKQIKEMIDYSWPMIPNNLSAWVLKMSDRLVIISFIGIEANAVYAVANKIPNILSIAQQIVVMAWHENASIAAKDKDAGAYYSKMLDRMFCLMFGCTALLIAGTPILFKILVRGDYDDAYYQMPILILAMFFFAMSSFFGGIYVAHKKTKNVGISTMVAAVINLVIDLCFVNLIGIWAGSVSTLVAYAVLYYYRLFNVQSFQPIKVNFIKQLLMVTGLGLMLVMCFLKLWYLDALNIVLGIVLFAKYNNELFMGAVKKIKRKLKH